MAKPEKFVRGPETPVVRYVRHLSCKEKPATNRSLKLLFKLFQAGVLRARNPKQLTFMFSEVEEVLNPEDTDFLEVCGHATAVRTAAVAGKPVDCEYSTVQDLLKELSRLRNLRRTSEAPPCASFFIVHSSLPELGDDIELWESENF